MCLRHSKTLLEVQWEQALTASSLSPRILASALSSLAWYVEFGRRCDGRET